MKNISDKVKIGNLNINNRFIRTATWEDQAEENGVAKPELIERYEELAKGGVGLIISGNATVDIHDNYFEGTMRLSDPVVIPSYKRLVEGVHKNGSKIFAQLALGGYSRRTMHGYEETKLDDMSKDEIESVIEKFVNGADLAYQSGFDGVEIHAAHFFFLSRSLSPIENHRNDGYGGTLEKRAKILTNIIKKIRSKYTDYPIAVRLNGSDEFPGGVTPSDCEKYAKLAVEAGADMIDISGNNPSHTKINSMAVEGYFSIVAEKIANTVNVPVAATGGFRSMGKIKEVLNSDVELIGLSRPLIRQPELPNLFMTGKTEKAKCISCNACFRTPQHFCIFVLKGMD